MVILLTGRPIDPEYPEAMAGWLRPMKTRTPTGDSQYLQTAGRCSPRVRPPYISSGNLLAAAVAERDALNKTNHEAQIRAMRAEFVNSEAELANAWANAARKGVGAWLTPAANRRQIAKILLRSGLFDAEFYIMRYPEVLSRGATPDAAKADLAAAEHYVELGFCRGYFANSLFDTRWYLERYEDVRRSGINPLLHYLTIGAGEGRDPGPLFQTAYYLEDNPDVRGANPLAHYLRHGRHEGRLAMLPA